jgi:gluconolactonase
VWDVIDGKLQHGREFVVVKQKMPDGSFKGGADGIRVDVDGNVWAGCGWVGAGFDGVQVFSPAGKQIGLIKLPEICSNISFGGAKRNRLFMTASQSLYSVYVGTQGAHIC